MNDMAPVTELEARLRDAFCDNSCIGHELGCSGCPLTEAIEYMATVERERDKYKAALERAIEICGAVGCPDSYMAKRHRYDDDYTSPTKCHDCFFHSVTFGYSPPKGILKDLYQCWREYLMEAERSE